MSGEKSIWIGLKRGLSCRCPNCGKGHLFSRYLKVASICPVCRADNTIYPSDDFPPYLTILAAGHVLIPLFVRTDRVYVPPVWLEAAIWLPLAGIMCVAMLPFMKGATVGLCWATNIVRSGSAT